MFGLFSHESIQAYKRKGSNPNYECCFRMDYRPDKGEWTVSSHHTNNWPPTILFASEDRTKALARLHYYGDKLSWAGPITEGPESSLVTPWVHNKHVGNKNWRTKD